MKKKNIKYIKFYLWEKTTLIRIDENGKYSYVSDFFKIVAGDWLKQFVEATNVTKEITKKESKKFLKEREKVKKLIKKQDKIKKRIEKLEKRLK